MNNDISNAHCGPRILFLDHAWLRVVLYYQTAGRPLFLRQRRSRRRWVSGNQWCFVTGNLLSCAIHVTLPVSLNHCSHHYTEYNCLRGLFTQCTIYVSYCGLLYAIQVIMFCVLISAELSGESTCIMMDVVLKTRHTHTVCVQCLSYLVCYRYSFVDTWLRDIQLMNI
jgi:hypothetical protein